MRQFTFPFLLLSLLCVAPARAAAPSAVDSKLVGRYEVNNGGPVATAVSLRKDGRFGWNLLFVENNVFVAGTWQVQRGQVVLSADATETPRARVAPATAPPVRADLEKAGAGGWSVHIDGERLPPLDVKFLAASGESATDSTDSDGNAAVQMSAAQTWTSIQLRMTDSEGAWLTLAVPPAAAKQRQAVVVIDNPQSLVAPYFTTLTLNIVGSSLVVAQGSPLAGMVYERGEPEQDPPRR
jgi:hypothetical protein